MEPVFADYRYTLPAMAAKAGLSQGHFLMAVFAQTHRTDWPFNKRDYNWLAVESDMLRGYGTHFFVESEELARLATSGHSRDASLLDALAGTDEAATVLTADRPGAPAVQVRTRRSVGIIHTCGSEPLAVLFGIVFCDDRPEPLVIISTQDTWGCYYPSHIMKLCTNDEAQQGMDLIFGLCLYLTRFPCAARPGIPDGVLRPADCVGRFVTVAEVA